MSNPPDSLARSSGRWKHVFPLLALMALSIAVQAICYARCATPAGDAVKVVHTAQKIDALGWAAACEATDHQPLYPGWVWCVHHALATTFGEQPGLWARAVQLAASIPLVLAVVPFTLLNIRWHGRRAGYAAGAFFAVLPAAARLGASGLADALHLLAFVVACLCLERLLATEPRPRLSLAAAFGAAIGAACLVRVEGLILVGSLGLVWLTLDWRRLRSINASERLPAALAIAAGVLVVLGPFSIATGRWVQKYSWTLIRSANAGPVEAAPAPVRVEPPVWQTADGATLALPFKDDRGSGRRFGLTLPLEHFCGELAEATAYLFGLLAAGRLYFSRRTRRPHFDLLATVFGVGFALVAMVHAGRMGYLSERHLLPLAVFLLGWSARGALDLGGYAARWRQKRQTANAAATTSRANRLYDARRGAWATVAVSALATLWLTFLPIQPQFAAVQETAEWLAEHCPAGGRVLDTHEMTSLYSGRETYGFDAAATAFADPQLAFVVVSPWELATGSRRSQELALLLQSAGEPAATIAPPKIHRRADRETLQVYRWRPARLAEAGLTPICR